MGRNYFSFLSRKIITHYRRIGYNLNVMQQSARLASNPIMVDNYAASFNCTLVGRASDSMMAPTKQFIMSPPRQGRETYCFSPCVCPSVRPCVRPRVRPSVCPSVRHKSCPLYNLRTVKDFSMKLGTLVNHDETMCHAQEP